MESVVTFLDSRVEEYLLKFFPKEIFSEWVKPPSLSSIRVNTLKISMDESLKEIKEMIGNKGFEPRVHDVLDDCIIIPTKRTGLHYFVGNSDLLLSKSIALNFDKNHETFPK